MDTKNFTEILQEQKNQLNGYLTLVNEKQKALTGNDVEQLNEVIRSEQRVLLEIKSIEQKWILALKQVGGDVSQLGEITEIKSLQNEIKELVLQINSVNNLNKYLISNAREFIKEIMTSVFSNSKRSLIDRKI